MKGQYRANPYNTAGVTTKADECKPVGWRLTPFEARRQETGRYSLIYAVMYSNNGTVL